MKTTFDKETTNEVIELIPVEKPNDGRMVFWYNPTSRKWKQPRLMHKRAKDDNKRLEIEQRNKDKL